MKLFNKDKVPLTVALSAKRALLTIKERVLADNDLAMKCSGHGSIGIAQHIDEVIAGVLLLETELQNCRFVLDAYKAESADFHEMLCGYTPEMLNDAEKAELRALIEKWNKASEEEE